MILVKQILTLVFVRSVVDYVEVNLITYSNKPTILIYSVNAIISI